MRLAVISDIHANLTALKAVLEDIRLQKVDKIFCLGDLVGYGPAPREVVDIAMLKFEFTLRGNHDEAVTFKLPKQFNPVAARSIFWTREKLKPAPQSGPHSFRRWNFLCKKLKDVVQVDDLLFAHGTPRSFYDYVDGIKAAKKVFAILSSEVTTLFVGHSHIPVVFVEMEQGIRVLNYDAPKLPKLREHRLIINVGSVGQPRDGNPRACYVVVDNETNEFYYRRVEYDVEEVVRQIYAKAGLPKDNAHRLRGGY
jgi:predicted phosphodiesterase